MEYVENNLFLTLRWFSELLSKTLDSASANSMQRDTILTIVDNSIKNGKLFSYIPPISEYSSGFNIQSYLYNQKVPDGNFIEYRGVRIGDKIHHNISDLINQNNFDGRLLIKRCYGGPTNNEWKKYNNRMTTILNRYILNGDITGFSFQQVSIAHNIIVLLNALSNAYDILYPMVISPDDLNLDDLTIEKDIIYRYNLNKYYYMQYASNYLSVLIGKIFTETEYGNSTYSFYFPVNIDMIIDNIDGRKNVHQYTSKLRIMPIKQLQTYDK